MTQDMPDFEPPTQAELDAARAAAAAAPSARSGPAREASGPTSPSPRRRRSAPRAAAPLARAARALRRRPVAFLAGAAVAAVALAVAPWIGDPAPSGSQAQLRALVDDYVAAVAVGDARAVLALERPDAERISTALLEAGLAPTRLVPIRCEDPVVAPGGDVASASCRVSDRLAGAAEEVSLRLERVAGAWRIDRGLLQSATIRQDGLDIVAVGDVDVPDASLLEDPVWLLPGSYDVEVRTGPLVRVIGPLEVVIGRGGMFVDGSVVATEALETEVAAYLGDWLDRCEIDDASLAACGFAPPASDEPLRIALSGQSYTISDDTMVVQARVVGTAAPMAPTVEAYVEFADDGTIASIGVSEEGRGEP